MVLWLPVPSAAGTIDVGSAYAHPTVAAGIAAAADGDTVQIHAGQGPEAKGAYLESVEIDGDRTLTIAGVGMPVLRSGNAAGGFFSIAGAGTVTIRGVAFDGTGDRRAARLRGSAVVIIEDCTVDDTGYVYGGGALRVADNASLTIARTTLTASTATGVGGFVHVGSSLSPGPALVVQDSRFSGGATIGNNDGGAVYCNADRGCTFERTTFAANASGGDGGAIAGESGTP